MEKHKNIELEKKNTNFRIILLAGEEQQNRDKTDFLW